MGINIVTCPEVVNEITNKRQLRRLVTLPYDLIVKEVFPEYVKIVTDFSKKTGDYPSLSATDIKVIALTYQLEKENVGIRHLRTEPLIQKAIITTKNSKPDSGSDVTGFYIPDQSKNIGDSDSLKDEESTQDISEDEVGENLNEDEFNKNQIENHSEEINIENLQTSFLDKSKNELSEDDILVPVKDDESAVSGDDDEDSEDEENEDKDNADDDNDGWITPSNIQKAKKQLNSENMEDKQVKVACMTTDFAMQNVLKQINLNVTALDGRLIKKLRTYILRCYSCFKTTSIMTKKFCPACGNDTLKKVAVSLDENGKAVIHINTKRPLTARGKKFSLPRLRGGKHPNNPIIVEDQPMPQNRPCRRGKMNNYLLEGDYIAGKSTGQFLVIFNFSCTCFPMICSKIVRYLFGLIFSVCCIIQHYVLYNKICHNC